jgi:exonuclease III
MAKEAIKLVSVNIELDNHLKRVEDFLQKEEPDVICLQEVYEPDFQDMKKMFGMKGVFGAMGKRESEKRGGPVRMGVGILSKFSMENMRRDYYSGDEETVDTVMQPEDPQEYYHVFVQSKIKKGDAEFSIGTTHFTWTSNGQTDDVQREHLKSFLEVLKGIPEIVFCGDFNAPRKGEVFDTIAQRYTDNIPKEYITSIDINLHRVGEKLRGEPLMVDGLFSTPQYKVQNVRLQNGVSDHLAIVADITK